MMSRDSWRRVLALATAMVVPVLSLAHAHPVDSVSIRSICHYEENYYVWSAGEPWRVWGRLGSTHFDKRVVLERSKRGSEWDAWQRTRTDSEGRYEFSGRARRQDEGWHILLRARVPSQGGHSGATSSVIYIDQNPATAC